LGDLVDALRVRMIKFVQHDAAAVASAFIDDADLVDAQLSELAWHLRGLPDVALDCGGPTIDQICEGAALVGREVLEAARPQRMTERGEQRLVTQDIELLVARRRCPEAVQFGQFRC
jgi:hypothetical protein